MILESMLQRLYASLQRGPCLNARPHNSRQRIDLTQLAHLQGVSVDAILPALLGAARQVTLPGKVAPFIKPDYPESEWSDEQKQHAKDSVAQSKLIKKLHDIANDAQEYFNDHGEIALFIGFPLVSLPPANSTENRRSSRILAPVVLAPVTLSVRKGANPGAEIKASGEGADLLIPNPALLAWLEQETGREVPEMFEDDTGDNPEQEFTEILNYINEALGDIGDFSLSDTLASIPRADALPEKASLIPGAILGLFPQANPGLMRDTKWMIAEEETLAGPVTHYLNHAAIQGSAEEFITPDIPDEATPEQNPGKAGKNFEQEFFIAPIDPSQAATAHAAGHARALVIHGPPGTGKSQTITNIIGDSLAKGQRVLFVCDKRTALDVVMHRLNHYGLGHLCGIVHDPTRDRRDLYMGLRDRMEKLVDDPAPANPKRSLAKVNERLTELNAELAGYYRLLHQDNEDGQNFHELVGLWLAYQRKSDSETPTAPGLTLDAVESGATDIHEAMNRAAESRLTGNPYFENTKLSLEGVFNMSTAGLREKLDTLPDKVSLVDAHYASELPVLDAQMPLKAQSTLRDKASGELKLILEQGNLTLASKITALPKEKIAWWAAEWNNNAEHAKRLAEDLNREWVLALGNSLPTLAMVNPHLAALQEYAATKGSFFRFLKFKEKAAAKEAMSSIGAALNDENADHAIEFFDGVRARWLLADLCQRLGVQIDANDEAALREAVHTLYSVFNIYKICGSKPEDTLFVHLLNNFVSKSLIENDAEALAISAARARAIESFCDILNGLEIFHDAAIQQTDFALRDNEPATPLLEAWRDYSPTVEGVIRLEDALQRMPETLRAPVRELALLETPPEQAETALNCAASQNGIQAYIAAHPDIFRIDTARIDAAFEEFGRRSQEKMNLSRRYIEHRWNTRQRKRLLAVTGTQMNSHGAALRNRLFVRGQRALKLRQMIATGQNYDGGDPLFDLCPVWMASPSTVAQIFPRKAMFDVVIFDEASQCRLEEALPVLLRGERVVVAGDPKQLPPTRFFESSVAELDDSEAETVEELTEQHMAETEDLLAASLNLDVEEAFLDVHYRSQSEELIGFSNEAFYGRRLQPIPAHPRNKSLSAPLKLMRVDGTYEDRTNKAEALAAVELVAQLLDDDQAPSIGICSFNINQRDLIIDCLEERVEQDKTFAERFDTARQRKGRDSFEGLFVRNLESVQGDERDVIIISTTFGPNPEGKFRRNFGALSRVGGDRRLNVLVTRARAAIHVLTSIPASEYRGELALPAGTVTGRHQLYAYLRYAEGVEAAFEDYQDYLEGLKRDENAECRVQATESPSQLSIEIGRLLCDTMQIDNTVHWGNDGFCVDVALTHPHLPEDVSIGVLADFNRFRKTPDPIAWEYFRTEVLRGQGWTLSRQWSPILAREWSSMMDRIEQQHIAAATLQDSEPDEDVFR